jgi:hypothetical protein
METSVPIGTLAVGDAFITGWRDQRHVGRILHIGTGSCTVKVPEVNGSGMMEINWSLSTPVIPTTPEAFHTQSFGEDGARRNKSATESPVAKVHGICDKMKGAQRDEIIAACVAEGINVSTAKTQYYAWRKRAR